MMSLKNVHPEIAKRVLGVLPSGTELISAMAVSDLRSTFTVVHEGITRSVPMDKVSLAHFFRNRSVGVDAEEGESMDVVVQRLSRRYQLHLVAGIDYEAEGVVSFDGQLRTVSKLVILPDSITLSGEREFFIRNEVLAPCPADVIKPLMSKCRISLALACKVFKVKKAVAGDQVSSELSKQVAAYLSGDLTVDQVGNATVLADVHDGITNLLLFKTLEGAIHPIRYSL